MHRRCDGLNDVHRFRSSYRECVGWIPQMDVAKERAKLSGDCLGKSGERGAIAVIARGVNIYLTRLRSLAHAIDSTPRIRLPPIPIKEMAPESTKDIVDIQ